MNKTDEFIIKKTFPFFPLQLEMEDYAREHHVPIISRDSLDFLISILKLKKPKSVLEFGTAIGYSSIVMASHLEKDARILTFERNVPRFNLALENIKKANFENMIEVCNMDATEADGYLTDKKFDLVFIDAAKGQYQLFFDLAYDLVEPGGVIVSDNIFHKGVVFEEDVMQVDKRQRTIYKRMNAYLDFLKTKNSDFFTSLIPIGDGIALTYKNERAMNE